MTYAEAKAKVLGILHSRFVGGETGVVILDDFTAAKPYGWLLYYNSRLFAETGDRMYKLVGQGPVVVLSETGEVVEMGSRVPGDEQVKAFERERGLPGE